MTQVNGTTYGHNSNGHSSSSNGITGRKKKKDIWYHVMSDEKFQELLGMWGVPDVVQLNESDWSDHPQLETKTIEVESFRSLASPLPFAIKFQLELQIFNDLTVKIQEAKAPEDATREEMEDRKEEIAKPARRMLLGFIQQVIPILLEMEWKTDVDNIALVELFTGEISAYLADVKRSINRSESIEFDKAIVYEALGKAHAKLEKATKYVGTTEQTLASLPMQTYIDVIKKRAKWPYAEYTTKFYRGHLLPTEFEIINHPGEHHKYKCESRRGLREGGWMVRDRFCRVTNVFRSGEGLVDWIDSKPKLCGREYEFLFDKGVGTSMTIWLLSKHTPGMSRSWPDLNVSRESFLLGLGCFDGVNGTKLGDRIGLAFSETMPIDLLSKSQIRVIPDINRNGYAFSDGCGVMGLNVACKIKEAFGLRHIPGAVQIRMGGVKGMLSLCTDYHAGTDSNVDFGTDCIGIRPSMIKFPSAHRILEVKRVAGGPKDFANALYTDKIFNQALLVLNHLGVPYHVFWNLQKRACAGFALKHDAEDALDMADYDDYIEGVFKYGTKSNKDQEPFSLDELKVMKESIEASRDKVNLPAKVKVLFGIVDVSNELEEGEVLVENGNITGEVLVFRSPCLFPGDIQRVRAIPRKLSSPFIYLDRVIVFSAKGERPLPDMLGGGDLDGDEYFVVYEPQIVDAVMPTHAHDYKTQNLFHAKPTPSIFLEKHPVAPDLCQQLEVLKRFISNGNLVVDSADAWMRVADMYGVDHEKAQTLAEFSQQALDSRKSAFKINRGAIDDILDTVPPPHYKIGRKDGKRNASVLGILYELWSGYIRKIELLIKRRKSNVLDQQQSRLLDDESSEIDSRIQIAIEDMRNLDKDLSNRKIDGVLHRYCITCNNPRAKKKCDVCGDAWVCLGQCEIRHWRICFGIQWTTPDEDGWANMTEGSLSKSRESTADTFTLSSFDEASYGMSELSLEEASQEDLLESLIRIVFGHDPKPTYDMAAINWNFVNADDLRALRQCVLVEFYEGFQRELRSAWEKPTSTRADMPHIFDVFTMEARLTSDNITLAVCLRNETAGGLLMWRDKYESSPRHPINPPFHKFRVASLSGPSRVLENLFDPPQGSLMDLALRRDPNSFIKAIERDDNIIDLIPETISELLNSCQQRAVATVLSSEYKHGFFLVQGPPGTGKTVTLAAMVAALKGGIVLASSNAAVANVAVKLLSITMMSVHEVVVYGENCDECVEFLSPAHRSRHYRRFKKEYDAYEGDSTKQDVLKSKFLKWLHLDTSISIKDIAKLCPNADTDSRRGQHVLSNMVASASVVLCTLNTAGSRFLQKALGPKFDTLFLDEAAQCTEAEFYIATNFPGVKRIILIGDPKQLNATVLNSEIKDLGYGNSFMTHVMDAREDMAHLLGIQYRCDPNIIRFSNQNFYSNALLTSRSARDRKPAITNPLLFVNTGSRMMGKSYRSVGGQEERDGSSWRNHFEAQAVQRLLRKDKDVLAVRDEVKNATTMVITPYRGQVNAIKKELEQWQLLTNVKIDTVDSFQGQEADIVIFSAVRTKSEGFTNDAQRINVALTRAKRVLRVVGDWSFWSTTPPDSVMYKFVKHCNDSRLLVSDERLGKYRSEAWLKPTWNNIEKYAWKPTMTSYFHHSLKSLDRIDRNIAFNTLLILSMPDEKSLSLAIQVNSKLPCWQQSALRGCEERVQIVWVPKDGNGYKPSIEAHFAGKKAECEKFTQKHPLVPKGTMRVKQGLSGVHTDSVTVQDQSQNIDLAWTLKESLGNAVLEGDLSELPDGYFDLDPDQSDIVATVPPLLLESGSGTGKTNVLFKHAVDYAYQVRDHSEQKSICFVTVSPKLRKELKKKYEEIEKMERVSLPDVRFFSLQELLEGLLTMVKSKTKISEACTFREYTHSRRTYSELPVDVSEAENEISGVILGSIDAALGKRPLSREEYIINKRSNINASTQDGKDKRHLVYGEYEKYDKWKLDQKRKDKDDVILELICSMKLLLSKRASLFDAVYLDEIQDFTYASIFLICNLAGKSELRWVCAGDTAQMISPGCSFKFDGLKQTMLAVRPGIESKIKRVVKLERNYRVTKDVLDVSNSILREAKKCFKGSIEYARPETAVKDLGTRVLWTHWEDALTERPVFGSKQALIFTSTFDPDKTYEAMNEWLNSHPFILTTLDAKGLEFEDVVVAFDVDRKSWAIKPEQISSLRLLRELYVAITRAKRRVVILIKKNIETMKQFFLSLEGCNIMQTDAKTAFLEFDSATSPEEWFEQGMRLFEDEEFKTAASCFKAADDFAYFHWAQGKFQISEGLVQDGKESLRMSARTFFEKGDHIHTLELFAAVLGWKKTDGGYTSDQHTGNNYKYEWNSDDDYIYEESRRCCPSSSSLPPELTIRFALSRDKWDEISTQNLKSASFAPLFIPHRENKKLTEKISTCSDLDREEVATSLPLVVGDYHFKNSEYLKAAQLYLQPNKPDFGMAEKATDSIIQMSNSSVDKARMMIDVAELWMETKAGTTKSRSNVAKDTDTFLLLLLFESPIAAAQSHPTDCYKKFGGMVIKSALEKANVPLETLHSFHQKEFQVEVRKALEMRYKGKLIEAVQWYETHKDQTHAAELASEYIEEWDADELLGIIRLNLPMKGIPHEAARRGLDFQMKLIADCLSGGNINIDLAISVTDEAVSSVTKAESNMGGLVSVWRDHRDNTSVKGKLDTMNKKRNKLGKGTAFLRLLFEPSSLQSQTKRTCMHYFGPKVVQYLVSTFTPHKDRYVLLSKFDSNAFSHLRPREPSKQDVKPKSTSNNKQDTEPKSANNSQGLFQPNDRVLLKGLKTSSMNGREGTVTRYDEKSERFGVRLDPTPADPRPRKKIVSIQPTNLEKIIELNNNSEDSNSEPPSLASRARSASSDDSDSSESTNLNQRFPRNVTYQNNSSVREDSEDDSDGSVPPLTTRNDSSDETGSEESSSEESESESDGGMPNLTQRDVQSSSSNDSRDTFG